MNRERKPGRATARPLPPSIRRALGAFMRGRPFRAGALAVIVDDDGARLLSRNTCLLERTARALYRNDSPGRNRPLQDALGTTFPGALACVAVAPGTASLRRYLARSNPGALAVWEGGA